MRPELRPYVHTDPVLRDGALMLLRERNSDMIWASDNGLRLVHQRMQSKIHLSDRYPRPSAFNGLDYTDLNDCIASIAASGFYLVRCRPFQFSSDHWAYFIANQQQVEGKPLKTSYSCRF